MKNKINNIGVEAHKPRDECMSNSCPWHGNLKIRGRMFTGTVVSAKPINTAIIEWNYYHYISKYERYERRKTRIATHNPSCIKAQPGDVVRIAECRPLSKSKSFVIIEKVK